MTDNERYNIVLRYEELVDKVRSNTTTEYEKNILDSLDKIIAKYVTSDSLTDIQRRRVMAKVITDELDPIYNDLKHNLIEEMTSMGSHAYLFLVSTYFDSPVDKALKFTSNTLIQDYELNDLIKSNNQDHIKQFKRIIANGLTEGYSHKKVVSEIKKHGDKKLKHISRMVVQSSMKEARKQAQIEVFSDLFKKGIINKVEWVATLEMNTCPICRSLDGTQYTSMDKIPRYPAHFRCRCTISTLSTANRAGVEYTQEKNIFKRQGTSFPKLNYNEWLKLQPKQVQDVINSNKKILLKELNQLIAY